MDENAKLCIYDPKVPKKQIVYDLKYVSQDDEQRGWHLASAFVIIHNQLLQSTIW
jgi:hypothetical protein